MLKAELHTHVNLDPQDNWFIKHSVKDLVDKAAEKNYNVLAVTCHNKVVVTKSMKNYALTKNIILISGVELSINNKHVLVYNITEEEREKIKSFKDLNLFKKTHPDSLIIAPHPFHYGSSCLRKELLKNLDLFDAFEYSFFYHPFFNPNKKTVSLAKIYNKSIVGNSDVHSFKHFGYTYTLIDAKKNEKDIISAIKTGNVDFFTSPIPSLDFFKIVFCMLLNLFLSPLKKKLSFINTLRI